MKPSGFRSSRAAVIASMRSRRLFFHCLLACVLSDGFGPGLPGRPGPLLAQEADEQQEAASLDEGLYLPVDRQLQRQFATALRLVDDARWSDAATLLDGVLANASDAFMPSPAEVALRRSAADRQAGAGVAEHPTWRSIKTLAEEAIGGMPREGREAYDLQFRARAERALSGALEDGDRAGVLTVARRWFHTPGGAAAAILIALDRIEAGDPASASTWLSRLAAAPGGERFEPTLSVLRAVAAQRAGDREAAESLLDRVRRSRRNQLRIAGREESLATASGLALEWLETRFGRRSDSIDATPDDWLLFRGNPARNAVDAARGVPASASRGIPGRKAGDGSAPHGAGGFAELRDVPAGPRPLLAPRYRVPLARHPEEARGWERRRRTLVDRDAARIPSGSPLAVGPRLLAMSPGGLLAIDFASGKRVWLAPGPFPEAEQPSGPLPDQVRQAAPDFEPVFDDATAGGLASDGRLVFAVESPPVSQVDPTAMFRNGMGGMPPGGAERPANVLSAYRIEDGSLAWRLPGSFRSDGSEGSGVPDGAGPPDGGPRAPLLRNGRPAAEGGQRERGQRERGEEGPFVGWVVGPPLPVGRELFVMVEHQGGLRLDAIEAATGRVSWSQPLADLDEDLSIFGGRGTARRIAGLSPSMDDGILVCPTGAGAVIAVDLSTRTLRWAYRYAPAAGDSWTRMGNGLLVRRGNGVVAVLPGQAVPVPPNDPSSRRRDGHPVLAGGRVVIAPRESDEIHCLDLASGSVAWRRPADNCLYVAGIDEGRVILVGQHAVEARRLADGSEAWQAPVSLGDASPSGRGFLSGGRLYLPLDTPEVTEIDLATGRIVGRSPARNESIPGNLVAHRGEVISQGVDSLDVFHQSEPLLRGIEAAGVADGWTDYWLGQLQFDAGRIADGLASVWRAHERSPDTIRAEMVAETVLFAMRRDFATAAGSWRRILNEPAGPLLEEILRHVVDGALASGDTAEAWEAYGRIAGLIPVGGPAAPSDWSRDWQADGPPPEERLVRDPSDPAVACSPERWLRGRLERLRSAAEGPLRATIDRAVAAALERSLTVDEPAGGAGSPDAAAARVWRFLERFGGAGEPTRQALVFLANRDQTNGADPTGDLAVLRRDLARLKLFRLGLDPQGAAGGRAGGVEAFADGAAPAAEDRAWPVGRVAAEQIGQSANGRTGQRLQRPSRIMPIACAGSSAPTPPGLGLGPIRLAIDTQAGNAVVLSDSFGRRIGEPLTIDDSSGRFAVVAAMQPSIADASVLGRLVAVRFGSTLACFEVRPDGNRRLWSRSDADPLPIQINRQVRVVIRRNAGIPLGMRPVEPADGQSGEADVQAGQAVTDGIPILSRRTLDVRDPITGLTLWSRSKLPATAELFGDETCAVVCPRDGRQAVVLSMIDGRLLATRDLPPREQRLMTAGRKLVTIELPVGPQPPVNPIGDGIPWPARGTLVGSAARVALVSIDPLSGERLPLGTFSSDARATPVEPGALAVLEPDGRFTILDVAGGRARFSVRLESAPDNLEQLHVLPWQDRLLVAVGRPETPEEQHRLEGLGTISGVPSGGWQAAEETVLLTGSIWALDRATGESLWPVPATLLRHGLLLNQPANLPLLTFVRQIHSPAGEDRPRLSVLCLDKRTGHAVYDDDRAGTDHHPLFSCEIAGDPESRSVDISRGADRVRLVFDGLPIPPQPPYQATATPSSAGPLGAIGRELEKWMQRALQSLPF